MTPDMKIIILEALEMKIASNNRQKKTKANPTFGLIYDQEIKNARDAMDWINAQKVEAKK